MEDILKSLIRAEVLARLQSQGAIVTERELDDLVYDQMKEILRVIVTSHYSAL
jgi:hypothetical protein